MFQISYPESFALVSALTIAIAEYERRLNNPELSGLHEETRMTLNMTNDMLDRLLKKDN